jgi:hypothetical protein
MWPAPAPVLKVGAIPSAITRLPPIVRSVLVVVMLAARLTLPVALKAPVELMLPVPLLVSVPLLVIVVAPPELKLLLRL